MNFTNGFLVAPQMRRVEVAVPQQVIVGAPIGLPIGIPMPLPMSCGTIGIPMSLPLPVGIPVNARSIERMISESFEAERASCRVNEMHMERLARAVKSQRDREAAAREAAWNREIERSAPLCMEVQEMGGSRVVQSNKRLSPNEMEFHMNRFNEMRREKEIEARSSQFSRPCPCGCHHQNDDDDEDLLCEFIDRFFN